MKQTLDLNESQSVASSATPSMFGRSDRTLGLSAMLMASLWVHFMLVGTTGLVMTLANFFGWNMPFFDPLALKPRDIEFVLVNNPPAPPRNKNTKNRADRMSRSGGERVKNQPIAETQKAAGTPKAKTPPKPTRSASKPTKRSVPKKSTVRKVTPKKPAPKAAKPTKTPPRKSPPAPKMPTTKVASARPTLPPSPVTPNIKLPSAPSNPRAVATGPVIKSPSSGSSSGSGRTGSPGPAQIPGRTSLASGGSPGRSGSSGRGSRGTGSYNQSGSPGGGGGRPGIDAMPEPDFGPYIAELQRRIKRNWNPPSADRSKRVVALFTVGRDGRLLNIRLQNSSGTKVADDAAIAAIRLSAPFRPLPANYRQNSIDVQFIFDYDVYKGKSGISRR